MAEPTDPEVCTADGWNAPTKNLPPIEPRDLPERVTLDVRGSPRERQPYLKALLPKLGLWVSHKRITPPPCNSPPTPTKCHSLPSLASSTSPRFQYDLGSDGLQQSRQSLLALITGVLQRVLQPSPLQRRRSSLRAPLTFRARGTMESAAHDVGALLR
jgi:hypothetical protein